jgi:hypothetical protein
MIFSWQVSGRLPRSLHMTDPRAILGLSAGVLKGAENAAVRTRLPDRMAESKE